MPLEQKHRVCMNDISNCLLEVDVALVTFGLCPIWGCGPVLVAIASNVVWLNPTRCGSNSFSSTVS